MEHVITMFRADGIAIMSKHINIRLIRAYKHYISPGSDYVISSLDLYM